MSKIDWRAAFASVSPGTARRELYRRYLQSPQWQARREAALKRAGHRCQVCNSPKQLDVHHRTYERLGAEEDSDLTVLCRKHHDLFHERSGVHQSSRRKRKKAAAKKSAGDTAKVRELLARIERHVPPGDYTTSEIAALVDLGVSKTGARLAIAAKYRRGKVRRLNKRRWRIGSLPQRATHSDLEALAKQLGAPVKHDRRLAAR